MRSGAATGHVGYFHEAACYGTDDELLALALPFLLDGVAAGEPAVVSLGEHGAEVVRAALPAGSGVTFVTGGAIYARPAAAIRAYRKLLADYVAGGAGQIRIIGEVWPGNVGATWDSWARYESAINHAYDDFPLWSMCAYDTRRVPAHAVEDVLRTHPRTALPDGRHVDNAGFTEPMTYLGESREPAPDPLQHTEPMADLIDPALSDARAAVRAADHGQVPADEADDFVVAVSEAVANAQLHGVGPVRMRLWSGPDRIVATVTDAGPGPKDPFTGLLPVGNGADGGLGLWIAHQTCNHVVLHRHADGFTIRLTAGNPQH
ncbi:anti-sigma regulatory factor (Ser/Thr protein kinase) [Actinoplanes tereljensis]|uniref:Anti-sigma regulatory factor n=1 Tax=Paractinoplanes tereljensis TaxID=571912 RepID=A0A919TTL7_9ACTN|nr:anti-sigma factor RsbA family regulatory protein [Actinoplanes tereljensis]GIF21831.1 anti-sigma regulatory factor [Actinoplanes tereljensis]